MENKKQNCIDTMYKRNVPIKNAASGITLIALVITIIVMLILAGVTISTLTGENGILTRASNAKETQRGADVNEAVLLAVNENKIADYSDDAKKNKTDVVEELFASGKLTEEERNKLLGLNGETEVDVITIGGIEIDFSKLNVGCPLKFGQPYSYMEDNWAESYIFYRDGSVEYIVYENGKIYGRDTLPAGSVIYEGVNIIETGENYIVGVVSPSGMQIDMNGTILILGEPTILPAAPEEPTALSIEATSITLNTIEGCEYSIDGFNWQDSTVFSGLTSETQYTFYARYKETATVPASEISMANISTIAIEEIIHPNAGLYEAGTTNLLKSWEDLKTEGIIKVEDKKLTAISETLDGDLVISNEIEELSSHYFSYIPEWCGMLYSLNSKIKGIYIPENITSIPNYAFSYAKELEKVVFLGEITEIGEGAFQYCSGITNIEIPNSVTTIGNNVFNGCKGLTNIEIPDSITTIGNYAFYNCTALTSVEIPNNVITIGNYAFQYCSGITNIEIPNSVTTIGSRAFADCEGLRSATILWSGTNIGDNVFYSCENLYYVTISSGVTTLGNNIFANCHQSKTVWIDSETIASSVIDNSVLYATTTIYIKDTIPESSIGTYITTNYTKTMVDGYYKFTK